MSTNNFKFENILVVCPSFNFDYKKPCRCCDDEDCEYSELGSDFDNFAYDEYVKDLQKQLEKIGFDSCEKYTLHGKIIAKYGLEDTDGMIVWLEVIIRSGYYEGMNIDYTIDGDFGIENEENKKQVAHYEVMHRKLDRLVAKTEKILRKSGTEMLKVAQFSNGEAMYQLKK